MHFSVSTNTDSHPLVGIACVIFTLLSGLWVTAAAPGAGENRAQALEANGEAVDRWHWVRPQPQGNRLRGTIYGNGILVAVGDHGTILTSPFSRPTNHPNSAIVLQNLEAVLRQN